MKKIVLNWQDYFLQNSAYNFSTFQHDSHCCLYIIIGVHEFLAPSSYNSAIYEDRYVDLSAPYLGHFFSPFNITNLCNLLSLIVLRSYTIWQWMPTMPFRVSKNQIANLFHSQQAFQDAFNIPIVLYKPWQQIVCVQEILGICAHVFYSRHWKSQGILRNWSFN